MCCIMQKGKWKVNKFPTKMFRDSLARRTDYFHFRNFEWLKNIYDADRTLEICEFIQKHVEDKKQNFVQYF